MNTTFRLSTALVVGVATVACGDSADRPQPGAEAAPAAAPAQQGLTTPDWYQVDHGAQTVTLNIVAGTTNANNYWNYNGFHGGAGQIVVPVGYTITINFRNDDPNMAHSIGVDSRTSNFPANFTSVTPAFEGGVTENPTSMTESTMPGESESISFVAGQAGNYSLVCYIPGHAAVGMYVSFVVSAEGQAGVRS